MLSYTKTIYTLPYNAFGSCPMRFTWNDSIPFQVAIDDSRNTFMFDIALLMKVVPEECQSDVAVRWLDAQAVFHFSTPQGSAELPFRAEDIESLLAAIEELADDADIDLNTLPESTIDNLLSSLLSKEEQS